METDKLFRTPILKQLHLMYVRVGQLMTYSFFVLSVHIVQHKIYIYNYLERKNTRYCIVNLHNEMSVSRGITLTEGKATLDKAIERYNEPTGK